MKAASQNRTNRPNRTQTEPIPNRTEPGTTRGYCLGHAARHPATAGGHVETIVRKIGPVQINTTTKAYRSRGGSLPSTIQELASDTFPQGDTQPLPELPFQDGNWRARSDGGSLRQVVDDILTIFEPATVTTDSSSNEADTISLTLCPVLRDFLGNLGSGCSDRSGRPL